MNSANQIFEPSRNIPLSGKYDVVVVGGGIAGIAAAVSAARNDVSVCLIERYCGLGGLATLGNVVDWLPICDGMGHQIIGGLGEELLKLSVAGLKSENPSAQFRDIPDCWKTDSETNREHRKRQRYGAGFNPASYMLALEKLVLNEHVKLLYDTRFCAVSLEDNNRISHLFIENKSGRSALACRMVIDATGDADVCYAAGEKTTSLDSNVPCGWFYTHTNGVLKLHKLSRPFNGSGRKDGIKGPVFRGDDADHVTAQIIDTREMIRDRLAVLRSKEPDSDVQLLMPPGMACFRMTRRLVNDFSLSENHVFQWFDDAIGMTGDWRRSGPVYTIPFRCLHGTRTRNLLVAGRCISVDNSVWDVMRVIPPCVVTGEAAGTAAALAIRETASDVLSITYPSIKKQLLEQGVKIDAGLLNKNRSD